MKSKAETLMLTGARFTAGFTLMELLVALSLMAVVIPVIYHGLHVAALAGEVSQRKELAARIGDRVINEAVIAGQNQFNSAGDEQVGAIQFHWQMKEQPWDALNGINQLTTPVGINQSGVNQSIVHQVSVDVTFLAQGKNYDVHLSTLANISPQQ